MLKILTEIYLNRGIHLREISRKINLGIPAVKNQTDKLLKEALIVKKYEGRNLKFFLNTKNLFLISYLYQVEYSRLKKLPKFIKDMVFDFLKILENKPILTIIFGSYAKGNYTKTSDLDILLVFNQLNKKEIEPKARIISNRYGINLEPIYLSFKEFRKKFFDERDDFMKGLKNNKIIINGIEYWVLLENEKT